MKIAKFLSSYVSQGWSEGSTWIIFLKIKFSHEYVKWLHACLYFHKKINLPVTFAYVYFDM